jgi:hypothetical protein
MALLSRLLARFPVTIGDHPTTRRVAHLLRARRRPSALSA